MIHFRWYILSILFLFYVSTWTQWQYYVSTIETLDPTFYCSGNMKSKSINFAIPWNWNYFMKIHSDFVLSSISEDLVLQAIPKEIVNTLSFPDIPSQQILTQASIWQHYEAMQSVHLWTRKL